jgi:hypothetical protein
MIVLPCLREGERSHSINTASSKAHSLYIRTVAVEKKFGNYTAVPELGSDVYSNVDVTQIMADAAMFRKNVELGRKGTRM